MRQHPQAAGRLAGDRHVPRVPSERADVALHPAQCRLLIHQAVRAGQAAWAVGRDRVGEEAQRAEPVVDGDHDHAVGASWLGS